MDKPYPPEPVVGAGGRGNQYGGRVAYDVSGHTQYHNGSGIGPMEYAYG